MRQQSVPMGMKLEVQVEPRPRTMSQKSIELKQKAIAVATQRQVKQSFVWYLSAVYFCDVYVLYNVDAKRFFLKISFTMKLKCNYVYNT